MFAPDPRRVRLSKHFLLSDFLGNYSVYSKGYPNPFAVSGAKKKMANVEALCQHGLEPIMETFGPLSVSYGYISPDLSREIVKYQDPDKPSHHRFDLGAAADIVVHDFVRGRHKTVVDLSMPESAQSAPISLALGIDYIDVPYSRLISYSESPYLCLALSAEEIAEGKPRKAFYENRYPGRPKTKPLYRQFPTDRARAKLLEELQNNGLEHDWFGAGYPTVHGGGIRQYHHRRVSEYTMVSDWLFDWGSVRNGHRNTPNLGDAAVADAFAAAGIAYDWIIKNGVDKRVSIVSAYVAPSNPYFDPLNDWRTDRISFRYAVDHTSVEDLTDSMARVAMWGHPGMEFSIFEEEFIQVDIHVGEVLGAQQR